jgi:hypothetical protein
VQFTPLGPSWGYHLLVLSLLAGALAVRCDSRLVASISLTTLAAWRGVSSSSLEHALWRSGGEASVVRINAVLTGLLFVVLGQAMARTGRKPHFEPVTAHLGWLLILGAILSGLFEHGDATAFRLAGLVVGLGLAFFAFHRGRFALFGMGLVAAYVAGSALVVDAVSDAFFGFLWFSVTGVGVLVSLLVAHHFMRKREPA